jgi:hypothetical protein
MAEKFDADHWRQRAKEARDLAAQMDDEDARRTMLRIAHDYDRIADRAEARQSPARSGPGARAK